MEGGPNTALSISELVSAASHLLPSQGPIGVFVHHNPLHAFQHLPFEGAVAKASDLFGAEPYMTESAFRRELARGRIRCEDLKAVLAEEGDDASLVKHRLSRYQLRLAMLQASAPEPVFESLDWELEEGIYRHLRENGLLDVCEEKFAALGITCEAPPDPKSPSPSDTIEPLLVRLCGAFLDQGLAYWPMPERKQGFYQSVRSIFALPVFLEPAGLDGLREEFFRQSKENFTAEQAVSDALDALDIPDSERLAFIENEFLALPGWAGMFHRLEAEPELALHDPVPVSLMDFTAVRLTLLRVAAKVADARPHQQSAHVSVGQLTQLAATRLAVVLEACGFTASDVESLPLHIAQTVWDEIEAFPEAERRRIFHLAYELRHERQTLLPLAAHRRDWKPPKTRRRPSAQIYFCLDDRAESIRRHLEEVDPEVETLGAAGFFGVAMYFSGIDDGHTTPLCPVLVKPQHHVREQPVQADRDLHPQRRDAQRRIARWLRGYGPASRQPLREALATAALGWFSLFPMSLKLLHPRAYRRLRDWLNMAVVPRPETELAFLRESDETVHGLIQSFTGGFTIPEMADCLEGVFRGSGLIDGFARLVLTLGHGSTSVNNPHASAYDCGACGGRRGGPNARLFAAMANHPQVRAELARRGIAIPEDTWFIGGYHDTGNDAVDLHDLRRVPASHAEDLKRLQASLEQARRRDAQERTRRFESASLDMTPDQALEHVEGRTEQLAEPRPECGHATNALCVVGRRSITRGLFLDRRAFLVSYDASVDPDNEQLARQLATAIPVCAGISLEYYFARVDNEAYGCGTKLPHNVTGLVGVMNGPSSDLRTGLPLQMVEIHEPVRVLFLVETTPERLRSVVDANPVLAEHIYNEWVRVATMDPETGEIQVYRRGTFQPLRKQQLELPSTSTSADWYRGQRDHLAIAEIETGREAA